MLPVNYNNVPDKPDSIFGLIEIISGSTGLEFITGEVFNTTSYRWELPESVSGSGSVSSIQLDFRSNINLILFHFML